MFGDSRTMSIRGGCGFLLWVHRTTVLVVVATVAVTAARGVVAGELRRRSGSVLASVGMHWATNALGVLFGLVAWRLAA